MAAADVLSELRKISKILVMANGTRLEAELQKLMTTDDRRRIWVGIDGESDAKRLSEKANVPLKRVQNFLTTLRKAELVEGLKGMPPRKRIDYVPPAWLGLVDTTEDKTIDSSEGGAQNGRESARTERGPEGNSSVDANRGDESS